MIQFATMQEEYSIYHIKGDTFIKVMSYDKETSAVNVDIFYKINDKYRPVSQHELPNDIVNVIATKKSEEISEEELNHFKIFIEKQNVVTKIDTEDKIIFGKLLHYHYILSKSPVQDYYRVSMAIPNEFGIMTNTTPVISSLVPYVFADIIDKGNKFKDTVFLIDKNIFIKTFEWEKRTLGIVFEFEDKGNDTVGITTIGVFGIEKDAKGNIKVLANPKDLKFIKDMKVVSEEQGEKLLKKLGLK